MTASGNLNTGDAPPPYKSVMKLNLPDLNELAEAAAKKSNAKWEKALTREKEKCDRSIREVLSSGRFPRSTGESPVLVAKVDAERLMPPRISTILDRTKNPSNDLIYPRNLKKVIDSDTFREIKRISQVGKRIVTNLQRDLKKSFRTEIKETGYSRWVAGRENRQTFIATAYDLKILAIKNKTCSCLLL
jgi:hypothetical protein